MTPEFDWDDDNVEHIARHGVSPEEAEEALLDPGRIVTPAPEFAGEQRWTALGASEVGRVLAVVFTRRRGLTRVVTARDAIPREKRQYRRSKG